MTTKTMAAHSVKKKEILRLRAELHEKDAIIVALETDRQSNQGNFNLMIL